jgi:NAD(P)-dependent dehydrogenase (short-subunit alcohol dehydrogenase family)
VSRFQADMSSNKYTSKLANTTVLICGATSGLGFGVAEALVEHAAAHLYISSSRQTSIDKALDRLKKSYPDAKTKITGIQCDLGNEDTIETNVKNLFKQIEGKLDHVVFTAGDPLASKPLAQIDLAFMRKAGMVRFFAPFLIAQAASSRMNPGPTSSITLTTGSVSEKPIPDWSVVASFASGLHGMTRALALELKPVRVNLISPGGVETELWATTFGDEGKAKKALDSMKKHVATGQVGQVEDVVESYLYAMKDKNVTGSVVRTDGGHFLL